MSERGYDTAGAHGAFAQGLAKAEIGGATTVTERWRNRDEPGFTG